MPINELEITFIHSNIFNPLGYQYTAFTEVNKIQPNKKNNE